MQKFFINKGVLKKQRKLNYNDKYEYKNNKEMNE